MHAPFLIILAAAIATAPLTSLASTSTAPSVLPPPVPSSSIYAALPVATTLRIVTVKLDLVRLGVPLPYVEEIFHDSRAVIYAAPVISTSTKPRPGINWNKVLSNMMKKESLAQGKIFINENLPAFKKAEAEYGVSKEAIAGVIRIETNFGAVTGRTPVFNAFLTEIVNGSDARAEWARLHLASFVEYCYTSKTDCLGVKGSWAGAFGLSQFLPYSLKTWGVDGNGDGVIDLFNPDDVIPSTANFLKDHGWGKTTASRRKALARYYGSSRGYPDVTLTYGEALKAKPPRLQKKI